MEVSAVSEIEGTGEEHPYLTSDGKVRTTSAAEQLLLSKVEKLERILGKAQARDEHSLPRSHLAAIQSSRVPGLKPGEIDRRKREGLCFRCGKKDHMKRDCPERATASSFFKSSN